MGEFTIRDLAADLRLGLCLRAPDGGDESRVESAHTSDLPHPARYVLPGELVLTNGLWLDEVAPEEWISEVKEAGAVGIGFGLSSEHPAVPERVVAACAASGLPLIEVPEDLSFSLVSEHVHERTTGGATAGLRRQVLRTRRLVERLASGGGHESLLELLGAETGLAASFVGPGGRIIAAAGVEPEPETARLASLAALRRELPCTIADRVSAFGVPTLFPVSTLVVQAPMRDIPDEARLLVEQIAAYGAFEDGRSRALEDARRTMAEEFVALVLADLVGETAFETRVRSLRLDPARPLAPIASDIPIELLHYAAEASGATYALAQLESSQLLLLEDPAPRLPEAIAAAVRAAGAEPVMGCASSAVGARALRRSLVEASAALRLARSRDNGERLVREPEIGSYALLLELLEPNELDAYRNVVLGPLERWDSDHGSALVETLRTFLELGGHWREAAARLHIHHNTLRYRLERVEDLTGRKLSDTDTRVDLFLALAVDARPRSRADD